MACRTLGAYTVEGAWDRSGSHTDRRSSGPGARTEEHARRPRHLAQRETDDEPRGRGVAAACFARRRSATRPERGERRRAKHAREDKAGTRPEASTRRAAWMVRATGNGL